MSTNQKFEISQCLFHKTGIRYRICKMYSKDRSFKIVFRGVNVKKSEIRLKSQNLHPCIIIVQSK